MRMITGFNRIACAALALVGGCGGEAPLPTAPADKLALQMSVMAMRTRADSAAVTRDVGRTLAVALGQADLRQELKAAFRRSTAREGKLHLQRFVRNRGANFARRVGLTNGFGERGWSGALDRLPDLEMYLPIPQHRKSWTGTDDLLVLAFLETDEEIRARGGYTAFTTGGEAVFIPRGQVPNRPVLVVYPVETKFGSNGEEPPALLTNLVGTPDGPGGNIIIQPPGPVDYCANRNFLDTQVQVCDIVIGNIGQYEEAFRGSPELAILTRAVTVNSSNVPVSWTNIGCNNEDQGAGSWLNQDSDHWMGRATITSRATMQNEQAAGKRIFMLLWEDDNGSKCDFAPEGTHNPTNVSWATMMRLSVIPTLAGIAQASTPGGGSGGWIVAAVFGALSGVFQMFATSGDDLIGSVALPAGSDPGKTVKTVRINEATARGSITFVLD